MPKPEKLPEPYLPKPVPQTKTGSMRTLFLWAVLIFVVVAVYQLFTPGSRTRTEELATPPSSFDWSVLWRWALPLALAGWAVAWLRALNQSSRETVGANELLAGGELDAAEAAFRRERRKRWWVGTVRAVIDINLGSIAIQRGDFDAAIPLLWPSRRRFGPWAATLRGGAISQLAMCHVLRGDLVSAEHWVAELRRAEQKVGKPTPAFFPELLLSLRRGEHEAVVARIRARWRDLEATTRASDLHTYRLLEAFALAQRGVREAGVVGQIVAEMKGGWTPGRFAYYGKAWPEMALFLQANGL